MWKTVSNNHPCPICGKPDWCACSEDGRFIICRRAARSDGKHKTDSAGCDYWLYDLHNGDWKNNRQYDFDAIPPVKSQAERAGPDTLDQVHRSILTELSLNEQHKKNLLERGLDEVQIAKRFYRSWPTDGRAELCRRLYKRFGVETLKKVPGFYLKRSDRDSSKSYFSLTGKQSLIIPVCDSQSRIVALKSRLDEPTANGDRYFYISSVRKNGPGPGSPLHFPLWDPALYGKIEDLKEIRITEGELKADIATALSGVYTISIPGVMQWSAFFEWIKPIKEKTQFDPLILVAFDSDARENPTVASALYAFVKGLVYNDILVAIETWDPNYKGIDDLLAAGGIPTRITNHDVLPVVESWVQEANKKNPPKHVRDLQEARKLIDGFEEKLNADVGYPFQDEILPSLVLLQKSSPADWERIIHILRKQGMIRRVSEAICQYEINQQEKFKKNTHNEKAGEGENNGQITRRDDSPETILDEFNMRYAVVCVGTNTVILRNWFCPESERYKTDFMRKSDFNLLHENRFVAMSNGYGKIRRQPASQFWLKHPQRRTYEQVIFAPGVKDERYYNLWRGFAVEPRPGNWSLFNNHIYENICQGNFDIYEYVFAWMADAVQNPNNRPGTALVLRGSQGTGKGVFCREFGSLFGQHYLQISNSRHLTGNFNAHLKDCLILYADEAFWAGDKQGEGSLKALITEPDLVVEMKGRDAVRMPNRVRLLVSSNNAWVIPAGMEERRFCVLDIGEKRIQNRKYFVEILNQLNNGGREGMLHDLLNYKLGKIDVGVIPGTTALFEQKIHSFNQIEKFWYTRLLRGHILDNQEEWECEVPCRKVYSEYINEAQRVGHNRRSYEIELGIGLKKIVPELRKVRRMITGFEEEQYVSQRMWCWEFPDLELCRVNFCKAVKTQIDWDKEEKENSSATTNGYSHQKGAGSLVPF